MTYRDVKKGEKKKKGVAPLCRLNSSKAQPQLFGVRCLHSSSSSSTWDNSGSSARRLFWKYDLYTSRLCAKDTNTQKKRNKYCKGGRKKDEIQIIFVLVH